jgi:hypothetical protein
MNHSLKIIQINFISKQMAECVIELFGDLGFPKYSFRIQKGRTLQSSPKYSIQFG